MQTDINTLNAELNPICHLLALLGAHHILHVSRIRVNKCKITNYKQWARKRSDLEKYIQETKVCFRLQHHLGIVIIRIM